MKKKPHIIRIILISVVLIVLAFFTLLIHNEIVLFSNPVKTTFSQNDIQLIKKSVSMYLPKSTRFIKVRYSAGREISIDVIFEMNVEDVNDFLSRNANFESVGVDGTPGTDACYYHNTRQYTILYSYPENNDVKKFELYYYNPGNDIVKLFVPLIG